jgi:hypothetical protein
LSNSAQRKSLKNIVEGKDAFDPESGVLPIGRPPSGEEQKGTAASSRGSGQPRFDYSNLIGIHEGVNKAALSTNLSTNCFSRLLYLLPGTISAPLGYLSATNRTHAPGALVYAAGKLVKPSNRFCRLRKDPWQCLPGRLRCHAPFWGFPRRHGD